VGERTEGVEVDAAKSSPAGGCPVAHDPQEGGPVIGVLTALVVAAAVLAIFATTPRGQALIVRLGLRRFQKGAAPEEDRAFLLRACGGDATEVEARLAAVSERHPEWTEAQLYRRAIRAYMNARPVEPETRAARTEVNER
jgi:hypothetical protein